jgi:hypothetical protein
LKRLSFKFVQQSEIGWVEYEDENGEYVRYEEASREIAKLEAHILFLEESKRDYLMAQKEKS